MTHVTDELELYALGALAPVERARVAAHLSECPACREQARAIDEVVQELPEILPEHEVPGYLRERILASGSPGCCAPRWWSPWRCGSPSAPRRW
jgi:anti-sigma factor RsiW